jgi:hypothetical protein
MTDSLVIPSRFCGPSGSGNGGYVSGRIAAFLDGPVTVTLRQPPPLATPMAVERGGNDSVRIHHGRTLIAEATCAPSRPALEIPGPVSVTEAHAVAGRGRYYTDPMFSDCFVCGIDRGPGDGLRIFPAAAGAAGVAGDTAILLGQITASLAALPAAGDQCAVIAWPRERNGRKLQAGSALLGTDGRVLATAGSVWLTVPRPVPAAAAKEVS